MTRKYDRSYTEYEEGYADYYKGKCKPNPYSWDSDSWWRVEAYDKGYADAQQDDYDD